MFDENSPSQQQQQMMTLANLMNVKDSRWLQLEVCREFQRGQCSRSDLECKFSHPPPHVEIQNGKVTACYDSIKGRCTRENPKCKYLHPPQHLKDQLLMNGRNNLAMKSLVMNQLTTQAVQAPQLTLNPLTITGAGALYPGVQAATTTYSPYAAYALNPAIYPGLVASPDLLTQVGSYLQTNGNLAAASPASMAAVAALQALQAGQKPAQVQQQPQTQPVSANNNVNRQDRVEQAAVQARQRAASTASTMLNAAMLAAKSVNNNNNNSYSNSTNSNSGSGVVNGKKRPLEPDNTVILNSSNTGCLTTGAPQATLSADQYLLAHAALSASANKRAAWDKNGLPFYQQLAAATGGFPATVSLGLQYPQYAAIPALQAPYLPYLTSQTGSLLGMPSASLGGAGVALQPTQANYTTSLLTSLLLANQQQQQQAAAATAIFLANQQQQQQHGLMLSVAGGASVASVANSPSSTHPTASNAASVAYFDESGQLLDNLPVCRDFKQGRCERTTCRYVHLSEDYVEVSNDNKVTVCRDFAKGKCSRLPCKFYHVPPVMLLGSSPQSSTIMSPLLHPLLSSPSLSHQSSILSSTNNAAQAQLWPASLINQTMTSR